MKNNINKNNINNNNNKNNINNNNDNNNINNNNDNNDNNDNKFNILDGMSGTGIRAIRMQKELNNDYIGRIVSVDK